jgi:predicted carbohydrate-binding protein with CBM5 and CBM33 domain
MSCSATPGAPRQPAHRKRATSRSTTLKHQIAAQQIAGSDEQAEQNAQKRREAVVRDAIRAGEEQQWPKDRAKAKRRQQRDAGEAPNMMATQGAYLTYPSSSSGGAAGNWTRSRST